MGVRAQATTGTSFRSAALVTANTGPQKASPIRFGFGQESTVLFAARARPGGALQFCPELPAGFTPGTVPGTVRTASPGPQSASTLKRTVEAKPRCLIELITYVITRG